MDYPRFKKLDITMPDRWFSLEEASEIYDMSVDELKLAISEEHGLRASEIDDIILTKHEYVIQWISLNTDKLTGSYIDGIEWNSIGELMILISQIAQAENTDQGGTVDPD